MSSRRAVLAQALELPADERADIAKNLIASLDAPSEEGVGAAWLKEVERRLESIDSGTAKVEPWDTMRERISAGLGAKRT